MVTEREVARRLGMIEQAMRDNATSQSDTADTELAMLEGARNALEWVMGVRPRIFCAPEEVDEPSGVYE